MKIKTNRFAVAAAILLALCLVFVAPVGAEAVTATVSTNEEFKANVTQNAETIVINLNADVVIYDTAAWNTNALGGDNTKTITINGNYNTLTINQKNSDWSHVVTKNPEARLILNNVMINNSGYNDGPWNRHDIVFNCSVEMTNVISDKALAFKNNAKLTNVTISDVHPKNSQAYAIWIQPNGQTVSLEDCVITSHSSKSNDLGIVINDQYVSDTKEPVVLTVKNTKFDIQKGAAITVESNNDNKEGFSDIEATITLEDIDISKVNDDSVNAVWVINKATIKNVAVTGGSVKVGSGDSVAKVGNVCFDTLTKAVDNANDGDTIILLKDVILSDTVHISVGKRVTLDLNGKTVNYDPDSWVYGADNSGTALLTVDFGGDLTIEDSSDAKTGVLDASYSADGWGHSKYDLYGAVMMTAKGDNADNGTAKLTVNGGTLKGFFAAVAGNKDRDNTEIIINGGKLTAGISDSYSTAAIEHPMNGKLTINGGTIEGMDGISMRSGTLLITGGTIIGTAPESAFDDDGYWDNNFAACTGNALQIVSRASSNSANENPTVSITGGTFTAANTAAIGNYAAAGDTALTAFITGGTFSSNPSAYIASGYEVVQPGDKYLVQKYVDRSSSSSSSKPVEEPEEPEQPEEPVVEPETPAAPGEATVETEVTDG